MPPKNARILFWIRAPRRSRSGRRRRAKPVRLAGGNPSAPTALRRRLGKRFGRRSVLPLAVPHGVAASIKCRKSCSYFCREQSRQSEGIAVAMARIVNAVIGKKNKTWCAYFILAATPGRRRAVRSNAARAGPWFCAGCAYACPRPPVRGASFGRLRRAENHRPALYRITASIPGAFFCTINL